MGSVRFLFDYMNKKYMLPRRGINKQWNPLLTYQLELGKLIDGLEIKKKLF